MELEELRSTWMQHEQQLLESTRINKSLVKKLLTANAGKRIDWLKIRSLAGLILPLPLIAIIVVPRMQFSLEADVIIGTVLFVSISVITYWWAIKLHLQIERLSPDGPVTTVRKQLKSVEKYKLKITRQGFILAPFMIIGIFLSAGIPFLSVKMIPFYALMIISFLIGLYVQSKHGVVAQIRKIDKEIKEINSLELEAGVAT